MSRPLKDGGGIGALWTSGNCPSRRRVIAPSAFAKWPPFRRRPNVEKQANYFGALNRSSPQWPDWSLRGESYAEEWCKAYSAPPLRARHLARRGMNLATRRVVEKGVKMLGTPNGREYLRAERAVYALAGKKSRKRAGRGPTGY